MARRGLVHQTTHKARAAPMSESVSAPTLFHVCCLCRKIRDETRLPPAHEHWVTQRTYRRSHGVNPGDFTFTHTYCPSCFTKFMDALKRYRGEIESSP
jgi:hypothetical protein